MSKPVILFVGNDTELIKAKLPDDSILVGWAGQPLERTPEWVVGPTGEFVHFIVGTGTAHNLACDVCADKADKQGYRFHEDGSGMAGIFQCGKCGAHVFLERKEATNAEV